MDCKQLFSCNKNLCLLLIVACVLFHFAGARVTDPPGKLKENKKVEEITTSDSSEHEQYLI